MKSKPVHISIEYNKRGEYAEDDEKPICAKYTERGSGTELAKFYFVLVDKTDRLYNPMMEPVTIREKRNEQLKMRRCGEETFYSYLKFLQTNNQVFLKTANRKLISGN